MSNYAATHWPHAILIAVPVVAIVWALAPEILGRRQDKRGAHAVQTRRERAPLSAAVVLVAVGTLGAAVVHASVIREHFDEAALYGAFFVVAATVQVCYAVLVFFLPTRRMVLAGVVGNGAVVALWAMTRFLVIPLGPDSGSRESIGTRDLLATAFELLAVVAGVVALRRQSHRPSALMPALPDQRAGVHDATVGSNVRLVTKD